MICSRGGALVTCHPNGVVKVDGAQVISECFGLAVQSVDSRCVQGIRSDQSLLLINRLTKQEHVVA
jgi:hypothetical protein